MNFYKIKLTFSCLVFCLLLVGKSWAEMSSPESLLQKAKQGAEYFIDVAFEIDQNVPELRSKDQATEYLNILDDLERIGNELGLEKNQMAIFHKVADKLATHTSRWIEIHKLENREILLKIHERMEADSAYYYFMTVQEALRAMTKLEDLKIAQERIAEFLQIGLRKKRPEFLMTAYKSAMTKISADVLSSEIIKLEMSDEERSFWIRHLIMPDEFGVLLQNINDAILKFTKDDENKSNVLREMLEQFYLLASDQALRFPMNIKMNITDLLARLFEEQIRLSFKINKDVFKRDLLYLGPARLSGLSALWMDVDLVKFSTSLDYDNSLLELMPIMEQQLSDSGLLTEYRAFQDYSKKVRTSIALDQLNAFGLYELTDAEGIKHTMTLLKLGRGEIVAGLSLKGNSLKIYYKNISYNPVTKIFLGTQQDDGSMLENVLPMKFKILSDGKINFSFTTFPPSKQKMSGTKIQSFENLSSHNEENVVSLEGTYKGTYYNLLNNKSYPLELSVFIFGRSYQATMNINLNTEARPVNDPNHWSFYPVQFSLGSNIDKNAIVYLWTNSAGPIMQLRAKMEQGRLKGDYLSASEGRLGIIDLEKIEDTANSDLGK